MNYKHGKSYTFDGRRTKVHCLWTRLRAKAKKGEMDFHETWKQNFSEFLRGVGEPPDNSYSLFRVSFSFGFIPGNVLWLMREQRGDVRKEYGNSKT